MTKVLFSSTWGPFQEQFFNTSPTDVMNQRFSRGCDIFTMNGHLHMNWAHLMAQNIDVPSVFLEYPRKEDFLAEVEKGYDYVALSSFHNQVDDLVEMCRAVREKSPNSKIVLGGWGAVGLESTMSHDELRKICDYLCHEEGISFMRRLLGEDASRPMFHSHLPRWGYSMPMFNRHARGNTPVVVGSLGCPNACDFCGTTEMFKHRRIQLMTPEQVYREFRRAWQENPHIPQAVLLEEDSFANKEYMEELGRLLREDSEFGLSRYNYYCLSSVRSMSKWTFEEMMLTGCATVFVGVESKFAGGNGYGKTEGLSYKQIFEGLHRVGISTTGAWMIGFDFQDRHNIGEDLHEFVELNPTMQQLTRVCPFPGTPMWKRMKEEGRIGENVKWNDVSFYGGGGMKPKNFTEHEVMEIIEAGYRKLYETNGASIARIAYVNMLGYEYCMQNKDRSKYFEDRALFHKRLAFTSYPLLKAMQIFAPNNTVRKLMKDYRRMYYRLFGEPTTFQKTIEKVVSGVAGLANFINLIYPQDNFLSEEPFKKYIYDKPAPEYPECPYTIERPHRTVKYDVYEHARTGIRGVLQGVEHFSRLADRFQGIQHDQATRPGGFAQFL